MNILKSRLLGSGAALLLLSAPAACGDTGNVDATGGGGATTSGGGGSSTSGDGGSSTSGDGGSSTSGDGGSSTSGGGGSSTSGGSGGSTSGGGGSGGAVEVIAPTVTYTFPSSFAIHVAVDGNITATFSEAMLPGSLTATSFTVKDGANTVVGAMSYAGVVVTLDPTADLETNKTYAATVTTEATDLDGNPLALDKVWYFTTELPEPLGPPPVDLGAAGNFVILSKSGIDTIPTSAITGNIGVSPIDSTGITGFSLTMDASGTFSKSDQVIGNVFAADYTSPTPSNLTTAVSNMEAAFTDAAGRPTPDFTELASGDLSGLTLVPGLYKWGTGVLMSTDVTLKGSAQDVWIFQISGGITVAPGAKVLLSGGALPKNIFWQTFGAAAFDTSAHFEGIVLSQTEITLATGASVNGRLYSQTAVTLDAVTVTQPAP